ncbi:unnamed protein product, partial [Mesorhabditis belari]|uniref:C2H2-type domain-containing protein n=1 Tax=Mesorhabditis belari TaxID=2138241 RepID=A0AAF3JAT5_9BILA
MDEFDATKLITTPDESNEGNELTLFKRNHRISDEEQTRESSNTRDETLFNQAQNQLMQMPSSSSCDFKDFGIFEDFNLTTRSDLDRVLQNVDNVLAEGRENGEDFEGIFDETYGSSHSNQAHFNEDVGNVNSQCQLCGKMVITRTTNHVMAHSKTHVDHQQFRCSKCPRQSRARTDIHIHNMRQHGGKAKIIDTMTPELMKRFKQVAHACFPKHHRRIESWAQLDNPRRKRMIETRWGNDEEGMIAAKTRRMNSSFTDGDEIQSLDDQSGIEIIQQTKKPASNNALSCKMCNQTYLPINLPYNCIRHVEFCHMEKKRYTCSQCEMATPERSKLEMHVRNHNPKAYVIDNLSEDQVNHLTQTSIFCFPSIEAMIEKWKLNKLLALNSDIPYRPRTSRALLRSYTEQEKESADGKTNQEYYTCKQCFKQFDLHHGEHLVICAIKHGAKHCPQKQYSCSECRKGYLKKSVARMHILRTHRKKGTIIDKLNSSLFAAQCESAIVCFPELVEGIRGIAQIYPPPNVFYDERVVERELDEVISQSSSTSLNLNSFIEKKKSPIVSIKDRFTCNHCNKKMIALKSLTPSASVGQLLKHSRVHLEKKQFQCSVCNLFLSEHSNANRHLEKHHEKGKIIDLMTVEFLTELCNEGKDSFPYYKEFIDQYYQRKVAELNGKEVPKRGNGAGGIGMGQGGDSPDTDTPSTSIIEPINQNTIREVGQSIVDNRLFQLRSESIKREPNEINNEDNSVVSVDSPFSAGQKFDGYEFDGSVNNTRSSFGNGYQYSANRPNSELITLRKKVQKQEMDIEQLEKALTKAQSQARMVAPVVPNEVEVLRRMLLQRDNRIQELEDEMIKMKEQRGRLHSIIGQHQEDLATAKEKTQKLERELDSVMRRFT